MADSLFEARWIVPLEPAGEVLENHALAVADGRILALLPIDEARRKYPLATRIALPRHALFPGLVNAHTHAAMTLLRGRADDQRLEDWLRGTVWPIERAFAGAEFVRDGTALAVAEMTRGGTTCFADQYFFPEDAATVVAAAGIRARLGMVVIDFPTAWAADADGYISRGLALHDAWKGHPLIGTVFAPHAPYTVDDRVLDRVRSLAAELDVGVMMHVHETADEVTQALATDGRRPLARLADLGMLDPGFIAVHMTHLDDGDIALVATNGSSVVHCPQSNMKLASGICPVARLQAAGVTVALGTDGAASNNNLDMIDEMRSAALLAKVSAGDATVLDAHTVLRMATLDGARVLGLGAITGSLVVGKAADFIAVDFDHPSTTPVYDPVSTLVHSASRDQVSDVWVAGRPLMREHVLLTMDEATVKARAVHWAQRIGRHTPGTGS